MTFQRINKTITGDSPGRSTQLNYFKIGPENADKKVFLQAALHADEQPGILVLHHLLELLDKADKLNQLNACFVVFPMVNPLGMGDIGFHQHQGRYDRVSGKNFNRQWPDLAQAVGKDIALQLGDDPRANIQKIRAAVKHWLNNAAPTTALEQLRHFVMQEAYNADYVFDLHCDNDALVHLFSVPQLNESMQALSNWIGASALLTAEDSGGGSFDEIWPGLWIKLAKAHPEHPIPLPVITATIEYRGALDTFDAVNQKDAQRLFGFFQSQGIISGELIMPTPDKGADPTRLDATEMLRVTRAGLLAYKVELGDQISKGDVVAELIVLEGETAFTERVAIRAGTDGVILSRNMHKYVWPGCSIAKIVGTAPLETRGEYLLED